MKRAIFIVIGLLCIASEASAVIGMPLTPMSYAGVARRTTRRAAYAGAATTVAPMTALPPGCVVGAPCGGTTYRPYYEGGNVVYGP
jgi:hypothetical protein